MMRSVCMVLTAAVSIALFGAARADLPSACPLAEGFLSPPNAAKPHTWYHMMNGNATKAGVTRDFEALAEAGIGGVHLIDAGCGIPTGPVAFNTPAWFDLVRHAASEARRLGLELVLSNCSGWSSSGGPWITPEKGMKKVVFTETQAKGPADFRGRLPRTNEDNGFYEDIAVLAYPTPAVERETFPGVDVVVTGNTAVLSCDVPFTAQGVSFILRFPWTWIAANADVSVGVSEDGTTFKPLGTFTIRLTYAGVNVKWRRYIPFASPVTCRAIRVDVASPFETTLSGARPEAALRLSDLEAKTLQVRYPAKRDAILSSADRAIPKDSIVDLTAALAPDGSLSWRVPGGDWTILRFGYVCNGRKNHPASWLGEGLEVDKLSAEAVDWHFDRYVAKVRDDLGGLAGNVPSGMTGVLVDSYEVGSQNWTRGLEKTFEARMGYSPISYLPAMAGRIVGSVEETERFLEDFRRVVGDLFADNYAGRLSKRCEDVGLKLWLEPYGNCPADNLRYAEKVGVPMTEFWSRAAFGDHALDRFKAGMTLETGMVAAHVGHVFGQKIVAAEAFTSNCEDGGRWRTTPFAIKALGDRAYAGGVNRVVYHRFVHQPWTDTPRLPGMTMGPWGMHMDRTQTWWRHVAPWFRYQTRCQWMLQEGEFVADVLFVANGQVPGLGKPTEGIADVLNGELVPGYWKDEDSSEVAAMRIPAGYAWDVCAAQTVEKLAAADGRIVAPSGVRYSLLVLPPQDEIDESALRAVVRLLDAGVKVCCHKPPIRAFGLSGRAGADDRVRALVAEALSKGMMTCRPSEALEAIGILPDFSSTENDPETGAVCIHRRNAAADWYFVALNNEAQKEFEASFRIAGKVPEIWDAENGTIADASDWRIEGGRTVVSLDFPPSGSAFVVFRRDGTNRTSVAVSNGTTATTMPVSCPWSVTFPVGWYSGSDEAKVVNWLELKDWTKDDDADIRYFSGTAVYKCRIESMKREMNCGRMFLDLGEVKNFAEVTVNGKTFPSLWRPPYRVDITEAGSGKRGTGNGIEIEIKVTNLWPNRLIGDDFLPEDCKWESKGRSGIVCIPAWVTKGRPSPTGRHTFTTWRHWTKDDALLPSGLLGPVTIFVESQMRKD